MAWCRPGDKPLSEPVMVRLLTHIWVTRPQWVHVKCSATQNLKWLVVYEHMVSRNIHHLFHYRQFWPAFAIPVTDSTVYWAIFLCIYICYGSHNTFYNNVKVLIYNAYNLFNHQKHVWSIDSITTPWWSSEPALSCHLQSKYVYLSALISDKYHNNSA